MISIGISAENILHSYSYEKKGPRKNVSFYQNIISLFETNPDKAKEIIEVLPKIGYYKDFMYLLEQSKTTPNFSNYIYDYIINLIKQWPDNKYLILAKWLPRENTSFDKKCDFVKNISFKLFPNDSLNHRREKYRKMISNVMKKLNVLETNLCAKTYDNIKDLTENNLKTYEKLFQKNSLLQKRLIEILDERYQKYNLLQLLNEYDIKILHNIRKELLDKYVEIKRKEYSYPEDCIMILDISSSMYNNSLNVLISKVLTYSSNHDKIVINSEFPLLIKLREKNISRDEVKSLIDSHLENNSKLDMENIKLLINSEFKSYTIVSSDENLDKISSLQFIDSSFKKKNKDIDVLKKILDVYDKDKISIDIRSKNLIKFYIFFIIAIMFSPIFYIIKMLTC